jgi:hypothetical protein
MLTMTVHQFIFWNAIFIPKLSGNHGNYTSDYISYEQVDLPLDQGIFQTHVKCFITQESCLLFLGSSSHYF